jgi:mannitol/fructose-specific phosphotransferase system IIA component (Ntr-type)
MHFVSRLRPELIRVAPPWATFDETIAGMVSMLVAARALPPRSEAAAVRAVTAREATASTAIVDIGVGVPHARLPDIDDAAVALAVSAAGCYEAVPTVPIRIVALVLSPTVASADHLQLLASAATLLRSEILRATLLRAVDCSAAAAELVRHAQRLPNF